MNLTYKNISCSAKTFYGVTFAPNEVKDVPGYVNATGMVRVTGVTITPNKPIEKKRSYNKKSSTTESQPEDSTSTENKNKIICTTTKEETPNG